MRTTRYVLLGLLLLVIVLAVTWPPRSSSPERQAQMRFIAKFLRVARNDPDSNLATSWLQSVAKENLLPMELANGRGLI